MKPLAEFKNSHIKWVFTDIDDTLTDNGLLTDLAYEALWQLKRADIHVIPITGRPAGWCELIARMWPVSGVIGENGAFYFRHKNKKMHRHFFCNEKERLENQKKLEVIKNEILSTVVGCDLASDQFCRLFDLAIDFCEDVPPLPEHAVQTIVSIFEKHGATAKVSSIHVNGWFGDYNKLSMCKTFLLEEFQVDISEIQNQIAFAGDSPNDEPMFGFFENSVAVANFKRFENKVKEKPKYICTQIGGKGFQELQKTLTSLNPTVPQMGY